MRAQVSLPIEAGPRLTYERGLALLLAVEVAVFCALGTNFMTSGNAFEVVRLAVEVGLLALALTPVIVTGGIDLSVGSLMGLSAVVLGMLWRDAHLPVPVAVVATLAMSALAGGLNALLITRLRLPPLIVTLGTYSLFRGLGEGLTRSVEHYSGWPQSFLFVGQGYFLGGVPAQLPVLLLAAIGFWVLLQRTTIGRGLYAIGLSPEGARHAGIPVERRLALAYVLCGLVSGLAAIIYVAHMDEAKADAGTGYELTAITAVVLGGTSIFGGRGTIQGTVLGLFAIVVLQNGLRLAALPSELSGVLTGALLLAAISIERLSVGRFFKLSRHQDALKKHPSEEWEVKNSQVAVLGAVILAGALIVAGSNWLMVRNLRADTPAGGTGPAPAAQRMTIAMMPKSKGNAYFVACRKGADEAAAELGVDLIWDGPTEADTASKQNEIVEAWITRNVDVIAVAVENRAAISSVLRKARERGIKVVTWDADAEPDARDFLVNQATPQGIGYTLMDEAARVLGGKGKFAIITATLTAANMIEWQNYIKERLKEKYPGIELVEIRPCNDEQQKAYEETKTILNAHPDVGLVMAICSPAVPGAAEAVKQSGRKDVKVIGLSLPNDNKRYVHEGITDCVILWSTADLGYLTVQAAYALKKGTLRPGDKWMQAGRLRNVEIQKDYILLGPPLIFRKDNIDQYDF